MTLPPPPPYAAHGSGPSGPRAGFGARLGASLIDAAIFGSASIALGQVAKAIGGTEPGFCRQFDSGPVPCQVDTDTTIMLRALFSLAVFGAFLLYEAMLTGGRSGQTVGKRALGIRVIDFDTGGPIGPGRAIGRVFVRILSGVFLFLGYLWMLWDREKQTWHDKAVRAVVVPVAAYPVVDEWSLPGIPQSPPNA